MVRGKLVADMTPEEHAKVLATKKKWRMEHKEANKAYQQQWHKRNPEYASTYRKLWMAKQTPEQMRVINRNRSKYIMEQRKDPVIKKQYNEYMKAYQQRPEVREKRIKKQREKYAKKVAEKKVQCDVD